MAEGIQIEFSSLSQRDDAEMMEKIGERTIELEKGMADKIIIFISFNSYVRDVGA